MDKSKIFKEKYVYTKPYSSKYDYFNYGKYNIVLGTKEEIEDLELELFSQLESYDFIPFRFEPFEVYGYERDPKLIYVEYLEKDIYRARFYFDNKNFQKQIEKILIAHPNIKWYFFDEVYSLESIEYMIEDKKLVEKHLEFDVLEDRRILYSYSLYSIRREFKNYDIEIIEKLPNKFQLIIIDYLKNISFFYDILQEEFDKIKKILKNILKKKNQSTLYLDRRDTDENNDLQEEMYYYDVTLKKGLDIESKLYEEFLKDYLLDDKIFFTLKKELVRLVEKYNPNYKISIEYLDSKPHYEIIDDKDLVDTKEIFSVNKKFHLTNYQEWLENYFEKSYCYFKGLIDKKNSKIVCYILYSKYIHDDYLVIFIEDIGICPQYKNDIDYLQFFSKNDLIEVSGSEMDKSIFIEKLKIAGYKEENGFFHYRK